MKPESRLKDIQIALKLADWFSTEEHVDYNADLSLGHLFVNGKIVFYDSTVLEFTESKNRDVRAERAIKENMEWILV